ncbi:iron chaperone [Kitasatospora sp. NPDC094019]|uniref:iron chaperone n=1 Tax=Kitasatospora sp. NPDC094019 TaxID=3364091 RepID=UPI0038181B38
MSTTDRTTSTARAFDGFTEDERAAMKDHARELKAASRRNPRTAGADAEQEVLAKIAGMEPADRALAERVHTLVRAVAPGLTPRLWYGMPAYAENGKVLCFFQCAQKFKSRYATLGFSDVATLDDGTMWPTTFALTALTPATESRITALLTAATASA